MSTDDVVVRLRLAEVQAFIRDVRSGRRSIDDLERRIRRVGDTSRRVSGPSHLGLMDATIGRLKYATAGLTFVFGAAIVQIAKFGITATATLEQVQAGFETMLKSKTAAKSLVKDLQEFSDWTPFVDADINKWGQTLIGFGADARQVIPILTSLGDAVSGMGRSPEDVTGALRAITQIASKGRLQADEVRQLAEHGIFAQEILQKGLGLTATEFRKASEAGRIASSTAIPILLRGLEDRYKGSMERQSKTIIGLWSTLKSKLARAMTADPDSPFAVAVRKWLTGLIESMPAIQAFLAKWFTRIWDFGNAVEDAADRAKASARKVVDAIKSAAGAGGSFGVGELAGGSVPQGAMSLFDQLDKWSGSVDWFDVGTSVGKNAIGFSFGFLKGLFDLGAWWEFLKKHWWDALLVVISLVPVGKVLGVIAKVLAKIPLLKHLAPVFEKAGGQLEKLGGPVWKFLARVGKALFRGFGQVFPRAGQWLQHGLPKMLKTQGSELKKLGQALAAIIHDGFFGGIQSLGKRSFMLAAWIGRLIRDHVLRPVRLFFGVQLALIFAKGWDKVKEVFNGIKSWLMGVLTGIANAFIDMINGALSVTVAGHTVGPQIPLIGAPKAARGATVTGGGVIEVGDAGRELIRVPKGADVIPLQRAHSGDFGDFGGRMPTFNLFLDGRQLRYAIEKRQDNAVARA